MITQTLPLSLACLVYAKRSLETGGRRFSAYAVGAGRLRTRRLARHRRRLALPLRCVGNRLDVDGCGRAPSTVGLKVA